MITASEAISRLKAGNQRFISGVRSIETDVKSTNRAGFVEGQAPFAIVLGCSDSRVPAEIIFDQGLGDLFVSVEFAAEQFGTPLVVVLGHSKCGAVTATLNELKNPSQAKSSSNVMSIVNRIKPSIQPLFESGQHQDPDKLLTACIHANMLAATNHLRHGSQILEQLVMKGDLKIIGAKYSLETGAVTFFE